MTTRWRFCFRNSPLTRGGLRSQRHTDSYRIKKLTTDQLDRQLHHTLLETLDQPQLAAAGGLPAAEWHSTDSGNGRCFWPRSSCPGPSLVLVSGFLAVFFAGGLLCGRLLGCCGLFRRGLRGGWRRRFRCRFRRIFLGRRLFPRRLS